MKVETFLKKNPVLVNLLNIINDLINHIFVKKGKIFDQTFIFYTIQYATND